MAGNTNVKDGVAATALGNTLICVWQGPSSQQRWRWLAPQLDALSSTHPAGIILLQVILPSSAPPDATLRTEIQADMKRLGPRVHQVVTVALGMSL